MTTPRRIVAFAALIVTAGILGYVVENITRYSWEGFVVAFITVTLGMRMLKERS